MRDFKHTAAQGEVNFELVDKMPEGLKPFETKGDHYILGHSESGNHHVMDRSDFDVFVGEDTTSDGMEILYALVKNPSSARQISSGNPHGEIKFDAGDVVKIYPSIDFDPYAEEAAIRRAAD